MASYLLVSWVCRTGHYWALHATTLVTVLIALAGALLGWRRWTAAGRTRPGTGIEARTRFLAVGGLIISTLSGLVILAEGIPNFLVDACS